MTKKPLKMAAIILSSALLFTGCAQPGAGPANIDTRDNTTRPFGVQNNTNRVGFMTRGANQMPDNTIMDPQELNAPGAGAGAVANRGARTGWFRGFGVRNGNDNVLGNNRNNDGLFGARGGNLGDRTSNATGRAMVNTGAWQYQGVSSSLEARLSQMGARNTRVLVLGDTIIIGLRDTGDDRIGRAGNGRVGVNDTGMLGNRRTTAGDGLGLGTRANRGGVFGAGPDVTDFRGGGLFDARNDSTDNRGGVFGTRNGLTDNRGGMFGARNGLNDNRGGMLGAGTDMTGNRGGVFGTGYGTAGLNRGMTAANTGAATPNQVVRSLQALVGNGATVLTVTDERTLSAMDRLDRNLRTVPANYGAIASDIKLVLRNAKPNATAMRGGNGTTGRNTTTAGNR